MEAAQQAKEATETDLGWLLDESDDAVVTLVAGDTRLVAHRAVLSDRSPVFEAMFRHDTLEASSGSVNIPDVEGPVLRQLVAYLYNLQAPQLPGTAHKLLAAADKYGVSGLKEACERQVAAQLTVETAAVAAVLAIRHGCDGLRTAAIHFIKSHLVEVMATRGWADAVRTQPEDVVEMGRLLSETSTPVDSGTSATAAPRPLDDHRGRQTPASAAPPTAAAHHSSPPDEAADSRLRRPAPADSGTCPSPAPHGRRRCRRRRRQTPASAAPPTAAAHHGSPPDEAADSRVRRPAAVDRGPSPTSAPASAALATAAAHHGSPPDEDADSHVRQLNNRRLVEAADRGAVRELEALLAAGADVAARDRGYGGTALHWAARKGHLEAARRLLAAGAAVDDRGSMWQETPLHWAAGWGHAAVARLLLAAGADHGARDVDGSTPLHCAAYRGHAEAVAALLAAGADRAASNDLGKTPLDGARSTNQHHVEELLLQGR